MAIAGGHWPATGAEGASWPAGAERIALAGQLRQFRQRIALAAHGTAIVLGVGRKRSVLITSAIVKVTRFRAAPTRHDHRAMTNELAPARHPHNPHCEDLRPCLPGSLESGAENSKTNLTR